MADDFSTTVTAEPPAPVPTITSDVPNQIPQPQSGGNGTPPPNPPQVAAAAAPQPNQPPQPPQKHGLAAILAAVGDALAGGTTNKVVDPKTGAITEQNKSTGSKVGSAISTLLLGAAAGAGQHGPGSVGRSAMAGAQTEQQAEDRRTQQNLEQSQNVRQTQEAAQQKLLTQASLAKSNQELARMTLDNQRAGIEFSKEQADIANGMQAVASIPGAKNIGHFKTNEELNSYLEQAGPQQSAQHAKDFANNLIRVVPNPKGGFDAYQVPKGWQEQPIGAGKKVNTFTTELGSDGKIKPVWGTLDAPENMTMGDYMQWQSSTLKASGDYDMQQANLKEKGAAAEKDVEEGKKAIADASEAYASGKLKLAQAKNLEGGNAKNEDGSWNPASIPVALVEHNMDPSQLSKRTQNYNQQLQQASQYSLEKYGKPYDIEQAQSDYKYASNVGTQNTLKMIDSIVEPKGSLEIAQNAARGLPAFNQQTINKIFNAAATEFGSNEASNLHTAMLGFADEYSKVMGAGTPTDTGRQQALDTLKAAYSKGQIAGAFDVLKQDIAGRKRGIVGSNPYLQKQYGQTVVPQTAPNSPSPQTHVFNSQAWQQANPNGDVNAAIAQAKQQGYQIVQ